MLQNNTGIYLFIFMFIFCSCASKKEAYVLKENTHLQYQIDSILKDSYAIEKRVDTIYKERVVTKPINTIIKVPIDCDSLGNAKRLSMHHDGGYFTSKIDIKKNQASINISIDSISSTYEKFFRDKYQKDSILLSEKMKDTHVLKQTNDTYVSVVKKRWPTFLIVGICVLALFFIFRKIL